MHFIITNSQSSRWRRILRFDAHLLGKSDHPSPPATASLSLSLPHSSCSPLASTPFSIFHRIHSIFHVQLTFASSSSSSMGLGIPNHRRECHNRMTPISFFLLKKACQSEAAMSPRSSFELSSSPFRRLSVRLAFLCMKWVCLCIATGCRNGARNLCTVFKVANENCKMRKICLRRAASFALSSERHLFFDLSC